MNKQIIALGGGGFSMEPENPLLDDYILSQARQVNPKICFLPTASGDAQDYIERFYKAFQKKQCIPNHLSLFRGKTSKIENFILSQDIIYVGGGNTRNLILLWKEWKLDNAIRKAYENGTMLCGISAGSICWFEQGLTDSIPNELNKLDCLGFLSGSNCPHFDGESERQASYKNKILSQEMLPGFACDDGVGLHFINEKLVKIITSRKDTYAFKFEVLDGQLIEEKLTPLFLG